MFKFLFSFDALDQAQATLNKLRNRISNLIDEGDINKDKFDLYNNKFKDELSNDLNTSNAITTLYDVLKSDLSNNTKLYLIEDFDKVLSLDLLKKEETDKELVEYINSKIELRNEAKKNKDYNLSDKIRDELLEKGIVLKDTREGTTYEIK